MSVRALPVQSASGIGGVGGDIYTIAISSLGTPDKFQWKKNAGAFSAEISITGSSQVLSDGVTITFATTTGHDLREVWHVSVNGLRAEETFA